MYSNNHAFQFIKNQPKLNQKHAKWVDFLQSSTFVIKNTSYRLNKIVDALSRVNFIVQELNVGIVGFEYKDDVEFKDIYAIVQNPIIHKRS